MTPDRASQLRHLAILAALVGVIVFAIVRFGPW